MPIHINEKLNKIKKIQRELFDSLGRQATVVEIAKSLKVRPEQVREYIQADRKLVSLSMRVGNEQDTELSELLADENVSPLEKLNSSLMRQNIKELLASLVPIQREVLTLRFGLENGHQLSLTQIGERLNLSRERIRQLEHKALSILRRQKSDIEEYLN